MQVKLSETEDVLDIDKRTKIESSFTAKTTDIAICEEIYKSILSMELNEETCKKAAELKKVYAKIRISIDKIHKSEKHFYLKAGQYVDAYRNKILTPIKEIEDTLEEIANHFVNLEKQRIEDIRVVRTNELLKYIEFVPKGLGEMDDATYQYVLKGAIEDKAKKDIEEKEKQKIKLIQQRKDEFMPYMYLVKEEINFDITDDDFIKLKKLYQDAHINEQKRLAEIEKDSKRIIDENAKLKFNQVSSYTSQHTFPKNKEIMMAWIDKFSLPEIELNNNAVIEIKEKHRLFKIWAKSIIK